MPNTKKSTNKRQSYQSKLEELGRAHDERIQQDTDREVEQWVLDLLQQVPAEQREAMMKVIISKLAEERVRGLFDGKRRALNDIEARTDLIFQVMRDERAALVMLQEALLSYFNAPDEKSEQRAVRNVDEMMKSLYPILCILETEITDFMNCLRK